MISKTKAQADVRIAEEMSKQQLSKLQDTIEKLKEMLEKYLQYLSS